MSLKKLLLCTCIIGLLLIPSLSFGAWYDSDYIYRFRILENTTTEFAVSINDTDKVDGQIFWGLLRNDSYIYSKSSPPTWASGILIANETHLKYSENETNRTGNNPTLIWGNDVARLHLDSGTTTAMDSTANNYNGTIIGTTVQSSGRFGNALNFDGDDDCIRMPSFTAKSISLWIYIQQSGASDYILDVRDGQANGYLYVDNANKLKMSATGFDNVYVNTNPASDGYTISDNTWYHIVVSENAGWTDDVHIGCRYALSGTWQSLQGIIDEVQFSPDVLTAEQRRLEYYNGLGNLTALGVEEIYNEPPTILNNTINATSLVVNQDSVSHNFSCIDPNVGDTIHAECYAYLNGANQTSWAIGQTVLNATETQGINVSWADLTIHNTIIFGCKCTDGTSGWSAEMNTSTARVVAGAIGDIDYCQILYFEQYGNLKSNHNWCTDNETLARNKTFEITVDQNATSTINTYSYEKCQYGCDNATNTCSPAPIVSYGWFGLTIFAIIMTIGGIIWLWRRG